MQVGVEEDQVDVALQVLQAPQPQQPPLLLVLARPPLEAQGQKEAQQPERSSGRGFQQHTFIYLYFFPNFAALFTAGL